ncbi:MAG: thioredoxin domain-containing protein [Anaerolineales bacterium]|nr:thioredoxin domain-containing protein [Anaerolineales bacterium]
MRELRQSWQRPLAIIAALVIVVLMLAACSQQGPVSVLDSVQEALSADSSAQPATPEAAATVAEPKPIPSETFDGMPVGFTEDGFPFRGDPNAPVTMIEYSDFQCPFCARYFVQTEPAINSNYVKEGKLRVIFRDFPIVELHPNAPASHIASLCAAEQGAPIYWEVHAELFRTQTEWSNAIDPTEIFARIVEEAGADLDAYNQCLQEKATEKQAWIDTALVEGQSLGISGTPSFAFNAADGKQFLLVGAQPFEQFSAFVDALVAGEEPPVAAQEEQGAQGEAQVPFWATAEGLAPDESRPGFTMAGDQHRGNIDAKITVIEFSDFQCPYCEQHVTATQPTLDEKFVDTGEVRWVFKHFPLDIHPQAPAAGIAAECAAEQDKFWEMHEAIFADQAKWSIEDPNPVFVELAAGVDLDTAAFEQCLSDPKIAERVSSDQQDGAPFVQGTPTFIVLFGDQGRIIPGALPPDQFSQALQEIIDEANAN